MLLAPRIAPHPPTKIYRVVPVLTDLVMAGDMGAKSSVLDFVSLRR